MGPMDQRPEILLARDLVAAGYRHSELTTLRRRGELHRVRRGSYVSALVELDPTERHRQLIDATVPHLGSVVLSHRSAAVLHGLPLVGPFPERVEVTWPGGGSGRRRGHVHRYVASDLQLEVRDRDGHLIGRSDFGWRAQRTLGEFDGRVTYGRALRPGQSVEEVVFWEKQREDALRDEDWQMVRWGWPDFERERVLAAPLHRAFARGSR